MKGFTLVELLVISALFSLVIGAISTIFIVGVSSQRKILEEQDILNQISYAVEYMGRALRMAKKEVDSPPTCLSQTGLNYEKTSNGIKFIDYNGNCTEFFKENGKLKKRVGLDIFDLTSPKIEVSQFNIELLGENQTDNLQPRVTIFLEVQRKEGGSKIQAQTTISQRNLDVQY
jgi:hypothetical protein